MSNAVLITGGAGFIGSHTCLVLLQQGHRLVVLDNFDNSSPEALRRVKELAGAEELTLHHLNRAIGVEGLPDLSPQRQIPEEGARGLREGVEGRLR